uniref:Putative secreted protein n=1 Tax=Ixodes ricinus TaxID=34613 RepID=A0A6B0UHC9_IXORI
MPLPGWQQGVCLLAAAVPRLPLAPEPLPASPLLPGPTQVFGGRAGAGRRHGPRVPDLGQSRPRRAGRVVRRLCLLRTGARRPVVLAHGAEHAGHRGLQEKP